MQKANLQTLVRNEIDFELRQLGYKTYPGSLQIDINDGTQTIIAINAGRASVAISTNEILIHNRKNKNQFCKTIDLNNPNAISLTITKVHEINEYKTNVIFQYLQEEGYRGRVDYRLKPARIIIDGTDDFHLAISIYDGAIHLEGLSATKTIIIPDVLPLEQPNCMEQLIRLINENINNPRPDSRIDTTETSEERA